MEKRIVANSLPTGRVFRFRLRANPCVTRNSKRLGLLQAEEQEAWIERKGRESCGFSLPRSAPFGPNAEQVGHWDVSISQARRLRGMQRSGNSVTVYSVLYDGILTVSDPVKFKHALENGVGHGKALGLGLLSVAPLS
jgi:CRISPR system Cascade subunit CasE